MAPYRGAYKSGQLYYIKSGYIELEPLEVDYWTDKAAGFSYEVHPDGDSYFPYHNYNMFIPVVVPILRTLTSIFG